MRPERPDVGDHLEAHGALDRVGPGVRDLDVLAGVHEALEGLLAEEAQATIVRRGDRILLQVICGRRRRWEKK